MHPRSLHQEVLNKLTSAAYNKLSKDRTTLIKDVLGSSGDYQGFWFKGIFFGSSLGKSFVLRQDHAMREAVQNYHTNEKLYIRHISKMSAALVNLLAHQKDLEEISCPNYLANIIESTGRKTTDPNNFVEQWEIRFKEAVRLIKYYSMNNLLM